MLLNLTVFLASAGVAAGIASIVWRMVTHERSHQNPAE
jgi:hypothetical protein